MPLAKALLVLRKWFTLHQSNVFALRRLYNPYTVQVPGIWYRSFFKLEVINILKKSLQHPSTVMRHSIPLSFFGHLTGCTYFNRYTEISVCMYVYIYIHTHIRGSDVTDVTCLHEKWKEQNQRDLQEDFSVEQSVAPHCYLKMLSCPPACL